MPTLMRNVFVDGKWYGPAHGNADQVPADVAKQIENPEAWKPAAGHGGGGLESMTVDELRAYASEYDVNLSGASKKDDIVAAIRSAED